MHETNPDMNHDLPAVLAQSAFARAVAAQRMGLDTTHYAAMAMEHMLTGLHETFPRPNGFEYACYKYGGLTTISTGTINGVNHHSQTYVLATGYKGTANLQSVLILQQDIGYVLSNGSKEHAYHTMAINDLKTTCVLDGAFDDPLTLVQQTEQRLREYYNGPGGFLTGKRSNIMIARKDLAAAVHQAMKNDPALLPDAPQVLLLIGGSRKPGWISRLLLG